MLKEKLQSIFDHALICDACLGRQFAKLLTQTTNEERGKALRMSYALWLDSNEDSKKEKPSEHILTQNMSNYTFKNNKHLLENEKTTHQTLAKIYHAGVF